jgi:hypothetical protein
MRYPNDGKQTDAHREAPPPGGEAQPARDVPSLETVSPADLARADECVRRCENEWRLAGGVWADDARVADALHAARKRQAELSAAQTQSRRGFVLKYLALVNLFSRSGLTRYGLGPILGYSAAAICALSIVASPYLFATLASAIRGGMALSVATTVLLAVAVLLLWPTDDKLASFQRLEQARREAAGRAEVLAPLAAKAREDYEATSRVRELCERLRNARRDRDAIAGLLKSEKYQLTRAEWRHMRGVEFEQFLQRVFELLGFRVRSTKASGDQGADLVVSGKGQNIAVQAKGYGDSVGNHAVMEVVAGMAFYQCSSCAVITNSQFTRSAIDLARATRCRLIDGSQIRDLIEGRIY